MTDIDGHREETWIVEVIDVYRYNIVVFEGSLPAGVLAAPEPRPPENPDRADRDAVTGPAMAGKLLIEIDFFYGQ